MSESLGRRFLISVPQLQDPNFRHSVILLVEHNPEGALGLVINRPSPGELSRLLAENGIEYRGPSGARVMVGGPVRPMQALLLHSEDESDGASTQVCEGIRLSGSVETLKRVFSREAPRARLYFGYAGWGPGQLETELEAGAWLVAPVDPALVFDTDSEQVWERALRDIGVDPSSLAPPGSSVN
jgi:putative transcriptional regulator